MILSEKERERNRMGYIIQYQLYIQYTKKITHISKVHLSTHTHTHTHTAIKHVRAMPVWEVGVW